MKLKAIQIHVKLPKNYHKMLEDPLNTANNKCTWANNFSAKIQIMRSTPNSPTTSKFYELNSKFPSIKKPMWVYSSQV